MNVIKISVNCTNFLKNDTEHLEKYEYVGSKCRDLDSNPQLYGSYSILLACQIDKRRLVIDNFG